MATAKKVIDFMKLRHLFAALSLAVTLLGVGSIAVKGFSFGLDFTGGTRIEVTFDKDQDLEKLRNALSAQGLDKAVVQSYGTLRDIVVRVPSADQAKVSDEVVESLKAVDSSVTLKQTEFVGPQVGDELKEKGGLGMLLALGGVMLYVAARFQFKFSFAAVLSLVHDVLVVLGVFSLFQIEFDLTVLAAVLAVIGYSLNDSIVVADRIRENFRKMRKASPLEVVNGAMTDTLGRTTITSLTTWLVVWALFLFGGDMIHGFALALLVGIGVGTYSSVYVCASLLIYLKVSREDLLPPVKEGNEADELP
ncbi:protein translocase subunit SecF [Pokkaliibacter sp. CJK22405]|uniref:protein translocase subunit SecF n=1 Tax=Pokkaliibacter sp. CJK22405 TaxID=3384615 RepID=UPI003984E2CD